MTSQLKLTSLEDSSSAPSQDQERRVVNPRFAGLLLVSTFFCSWSIAHGVDSLVSLKLSALIVSQCAFGALLWQKASIDRCPPVIEQIAIGFVIASTLSAILDQAFVGWHDRFTPLFALNVAIGAISVWRWTTTASRNITIESSNIYVYPLCAACVAIGIGGSNGWFIYTLCLVSTATVMFVKSRFFATWQGLALGIGLVSISSSAIFFLRPDLPTHSWSLFRLFTGTDDQIYSEASSNSLVHLGPLDSIFAPGHHVPYHWFTFAWTGSLGHLVNADAFTATLHIATPIGFFFIARLIWSIVRHLVAHEVAGVAALLATFATSSLPTPLRFVNQINTSNTLTHLWLLLAFMLFVRLLDRSIRLAGMMLCFTAAIVLLAKVPYGAVLYLGLLAALPISILSGKLSLKSGVLVISGLLGSASLTYWIFLSPEPFQDRGFRLFVNSANFGIGTRWYPLVPIVLISAIAISRFAYVLVMETKWVFQHLEIVVFLITATTGSLVRFVVEGSSAENYFLNAGLLFAGIGIGVFWGLKFPFLDNHVRLVVLATLLLSAVINLGASFVTDIQKQSAPLVILPVFLAGSAVLAVGIVELVKKRRIGVLVIPVLASVLLGSSFGAYLRISRMEPAIEPASVVSANEIEGLTWLRSQTDFSDLVATNRNLCGSQIPCDYDETRQVVAAFADRQVLIEGPRFLNGARDYPNWAKFRIRDALQFAGSPSMQSLDALRAYGVSWFYLVKTDPRVAPMINFEKLATPVVFENSDIAIIDLRIG
jgi:hypothetical protein